jgi:sterol desaturase/sphingolipid hydroxylase (fatty acid hydroxylase superfamily)
MPEKQKQINESLLGAALRTILNMSKTCANYWGEFAIDIPLSFMLIFASLRSHDLSPLVVVLTIGFGLILFSFFEYFIHRWLFHGSSVWLMAEGHNAHHLNPMGYDSLPFFLPAMVLMILTGIFVFMMPMSEAFLLTGTITFGYVTYGLSHFAIHHVHFQRSWAKHWSAHHLIHHVHTNTNFGVTTTIWDMLLCTRYAYDHKK